KKISKLANSQVLFDAMDVVVSRRITVDFKNLIEIVFQEIEAVGVDVEAHHMLDGLILRRHARPEAQSAEKCETGDESTKGFGPKLFHGGSLPHIIARR